MQIQNSLSRTAAHSVRSSRSSLRWVSAMLVACVVSVSSALAGVPEPDTLIFGAIALDGKFVKASDTSVIVELRSQADGPVLSAYRMGASAPAGDRYVLRLAMEDIVPILQSNTVALGSQVLLSVRDNSGIRDQATLTITNRGQFIQFDFGDVDTDGDGMSDRFELRYFGSITGGDPNADPDGDGRPNFREAQQGTNPLKADGRHPADFAPADDNLTIKEVTDYALAWQTGAKWSIEPTNIPIAYVTRAGALWKGGEHYVFDNDPVTNAPNWWVNAPASAGAPPLAPPSDTASSGSVAPNSVWSEVPTRYSNGVPLVVKTQVQPSEGIRVYAVEDQVPEGWLVRNISASGRLDRVNRKIKWGPFFDTSARELSYQLVPTSELSGVVQLAGTASFDGSDVVISGTRWMTAGDPAARLALASTSDGHVRIALSGVAGVTYQVERSSDLNHWEAWKSVRLTAGASGNGEALWVESTEGTAAYFRAAPAAATH